MTEAQKKDITQAVSDAEKRLFDAGFSDEEVTVTFDQEAQLVCANFSTEDALTDDKFLAIWEATPDVFVRFRSSDLQKRYGTFLTAHRSDAMLNSLRAKLEQLDLLNGFPRRSDYEDFGHYLRALESHSGAPPNSLTLAGDVVDAPFIEQQQTGFHNPEMAWRLISVAGFAALTEGFRFRNLG